jgi:hypothetical protein
MKVNAMAVDRIRHTKPASKRTFLDELEPIPYEITREEIEAMDPRMRKILFGIEESESGGEADEQPAIEEAVGDDLIPPPGPVDLFEPDAASEENAEPVVKSEPEEQPAPFDPAALAEEFRGTPHPCVILVFPAESSESELLELARSGQEYRQSEADGRIWHVAVFRREHAESLKRINDLLGPRDGAVALYNGKRVPFGRSLWLPLMYVFTAGLADE